MQQPEAGHPGWHVGLVSRVALERWGVYPLVALSAAAVALPARLHGAFDVRVWAPLGIALALLAAVLVAAGGRARPLVAAACASAVALGFWSALSVAWGGLPNEAWDTLGQWLLASTALLVASLLATSQRRSAAIAGGVLLGIVAHAAELLGRLATSGVPEWFSERSLDGLVGYHNAEAALLALGIPFALAAYAADRRVVRVLSGAGGGLLTGALLLTQSRGGLIAAALGVAVLLVWGRRLAPALGALALCGAGLALSRALPRVDAAIVDGSLAEQQGALRAFVLWTVLAACVLAALGLVRPPRSIPAGRPRRVAIAAVGLAAVVAVVAVATVGRPAVGRVGDALGSLSSDANPNLAEAGATRFTSLSLSGREWVWRVAGDQGASNLPLGAGEGQFARAWTLERDTFNLYVLHAHSVELELFAELGPVGVLLFAAFVGLVAIAVARGPSRQLAAAALGGLAVVLAQGSIDWTWSFPGVLVPMLLVAGAAAGAGATRQPGIPRIAVTSLAVTTIVLVLGALWFSSVDAGRAERLAAVDPRAAWENASRALLVNPWNAEALSVQGQIAADAGDLPRATDLFEHAATRSQRPSLEYYRLARALGEAGRQTDAEQACDRARALDPLAPRLASCGLADFFDE